MSRYNRRTLPAAPSTIRPQPNIAPVIASSMVLPREKLKGEAAKLQMAHDMRQAGVVTDRELEVMGWSEKQIREIGLDANRIAQSLAGASA